MMKKLIIAILAVFVFAACNSSQHQNTEQDRHFEITFDINKEKNEEASLTFAIALDSGYYFVSPHSNYMQRLIFSIEDTDSLMLKGELIESPVTFEEYDSLSNHLGRFVRKNTTYSQKLIVGSKNDFEVNGLIWLEILPICQPYDISFVISNQSGNLTVEKTSTYNSTYPTFWDNKRVDIPINNAN